jgi:oligopeptide transport system permease protein
VLFSIGAPLPFAERVLHITLGLALTIIVPHAYLGHFDVVVPGVILFEALLSFLGLGVHAPLASLGSLVAEGANEMQANPYLLVIPAAFLATIILCLNRLGDALRAALDPRGGEDGHG